MSDRDRDRRFYGSIYGGFADSLNAASAEGGLSERTRFEGEEAFASLQEFLGVVHALASERRLSRLVYVARKP